MKHEPVIMPTTAAVTTTSAVTDPVSGKPLNGVSADVNATEADKVLLVISGVVPLVAAELVSIYTVNSTGGLVPVYDQTLAAASLKPALSSILLEGGFIYRLVKTVTASAAGVDAYLKPRR